MSLNNSNSINLNAQYKSWSASRILEILENTRGRRREQHSGSSLEHIWRHREEELMLYAERYPMLTQRLLTCLLYSDRFITLESAKDNVVRHVAEMCKYALHVHDEYMRQIRAISHNNSINFNHEYNKCIRKINDSNYGCKLYNSSINRELYMTIVKTLLRRPPSEVTFAATFTNSILYESSLPIIHNLLQKLMSEPSDFILHRWLNLPITSLTSSSKTEIHLQQMERLSKEDVFDSNSELEQERQQKHHKVNGDTVGGEQCKSKHFLITLQEMLYEIIYTNSNEAKNTGSITEYCKNRARNNAVSIHGLQHNTDIVKPEQEEEQSEKEEYLEEYKLEDEMCKNNLNEKAKIESVEGETCDTSVKTRVQLQRVFRQGSFVKWAKEHSSNINQWQKFVKTLPIPVKTRSQEEVCKLIQRHNVSKQNQILTTQNRQNNNNESEVGLSTTTAAASISHVHRAIPEWIDKSDSDSDKDEINDDVTALSVDNNPYNSTEVENNMNEMNKNDNIISAIANNNDNSSSVVPPPPPPPPLPSVTWVQDGELTLKDGKFVVLPTNAETGHRKRQHLSNSGSNEQVSASKKSNTNYDDNVNKANANVVRTDMDKVNRSVNETKEWKQNEQNEQLQGQLIETREEESKQNTSTTPFWLSKSDKNDDINTTEGNNKLLVTEAAQTANKISSIHDKNKVSIHTKRQRTRKQNKVEVEKSSVHTPHNKTSTSELNKTSANMISRSKHSNHSRVRNSKHMSNNNDINNSSTQLNTIEEKKGDNKAINIVSTHNVPLLSREMLWELLHHRWNISSTLQDALSIGLETDTSAMHEKVRNYNSTCNGDSNNMFSTNNNINNANNMSNTSITVTADNLKQDYTHAALTSVQKEQQQIKQTDILPDSVETINSPSESTTYDSSGPHSHSSRELSLSSSSALSVSASAMSSSISSPSIDFDDDEEDDDYPNMGDFIII